MTTRVRRYELASHLAIAPTTISTWKSRYLDFPQPVGRFYDLEAVKKWKAQHDDKESHTRKGIHRPTH
jgi:uncharacterized protein YjcR